MAPGRARAGAPTRGRLAVGRVDRRDRARHRGAAAQRPSVLAVDATVTDVDRRRIRASSRPILVHPSASTSACARARSTQATRSRSSSPTSTATPVPGVPIDVAIEGVLGSERYRDDAKVDRHAALQARPAARAPVAVRVHARDDRRHAYTRDRADRRRARPHERRAAPRSRGGRRRPTATSRSSPTSRATGPATSRSSRSARRSCRRRRSSRSRARA